jgi:hypothetical protein
VRRIQEKGYTFSDAPEKRFVSEKTHRRITKESFVDEEPVQKVKGIVWDLVLLGRSMLRPSLPGVCFLS